MAATTVTRRPVQRFDQVSPADFKALATPRLLQWRLTQRHALAAARIKERIARLLTADIDLPTFAWGLEALGYHPSTIAKYLSLARQLVPSMKEDRELMRIIKHFSSMSNAVRASREPRALTIPQVRSLIGDLSTALQWAIRITFVTASRISDWRHVKVLFHPNLLEIRYVMPWKSDQSLSRRIVKWLPRTRADSPAVWREALETLVLHRESVLTHIRKVAPNLGGHSLRHGAIVFLESLGVPVDSIATLTNHAPCKRFSALQEHYFASWSPPTSSRSKECLKVVSRLQAALELP
jgi:hypothetical protein